MNQNLQIVISLFARLLGSNNIEEEIQKEILNILRNLIQKYSSLMMQIFQSLPLEEQQNLHKFGF